LTLWQQFFYFGTDDFPFKFLLKVFQNRFSVWASRSGFGAAIGVAVVRNSCVLCNSAAAAASAILLCFAAESRKSYCNGCMKVANGALAAVFSFWR